MTTETLTLLAGAALSLVASYVPHVRTWYASLSTDGKRGVMALALALVAVLSVVNGCTGVFADLATECSTAGVEELVRAFVGALVANQATYLITVHD